VRLIVVTLMALLSSATPLHADEHPAYAGGGVTVSTWSGRESPELSASLRELNSTGATVAGVSAEAGVSVRRGLSLGAEVTIPGRHEWTQTSHYLVHPAQTKTRYRDATFSGVARLQRPSGMFRPGLVGGLDLVLQDSLERGAAGHVGPGGAITFDPLGEEHSNRAWTIGAAVGADASLAISDRVAIVPGARLHFIYREGVLGGSIGRLNVSGVVLRAGVSVRATF